MGNMLALALVLLGLAAVALAFTLLGTGAMHVLSHAMAGP